MMNILFIGSHPTSQLIKSTEGKIDSLYRDSNALIEGFRSLSDVKLDVITSPDIRSFPKNRLFFKKHFDNLDNTTMVSSLNLPILKQFWTICSMLIEARRIIKNNKGDTTIILPYMVFRHTAVGRILQSFFPHKVKICIVIPDIFFPKKKILKWYFSKAEKMAKKFDCFVLYTDAMSNYLGIKRKPYIVIEGFYNVQSQSTFPPKDKFIVTYAGSLAIRYGIKRLLDAFKLLNNQDIELHLYGKGDADSLIKEQAKTDSRIKYFGLVPKEQATAALYKSSLLINPRNDKDGEYVQYSFPSKDIDYLASGVPCVLCKLPGMPNEYYGHFIDAGNGSPESLAGAIKYAYLMTPEQRCAKAAEAQQFIAARMDTKKQAEQIISMINNIDSLPKSNTNI